MNKAEVFEFLNQNPVFHLATTEGDQPRVRGMLLFSADERGIIFHTGSSKDVYNQILDNPKAELCFQGNGRQVRIAGILENVQDEELKDEIFNHPSRKFLQSWKDIGIDKMFQIFILKNGVVQEWTMEKNFAEKEYINI